jgi:hypothetical protein
MFNGTKARPELVLNNRASTHQSWNRTEPSPVLLVLKNFLFDKRPYPLFLSRANTSNVSVNSKEKKADVIKIFV